MKKGKLALVSGLLALASMGERMPVDIATRGSVKYHKPTSTLSKKAWQKRKVKLRMQKESRRANRV